MYKMDFWSREINLHIDQSRTGVPNKQTNRKRQSMTTLASENVDGSLKWKIAAEFYISSTSF
jgi:hypothetical protein